MFAVCCLLFAARCLLLAVRCLSFDFCLLCACLLYVVCSLLRVVWSV